MEHLSNNVGSDRTNRRKKLLNREQFLCFQFAASLWCWSAMLDAGLITLSYYVYVELASVLCKCKFLMCVCVSSCHRTPIKHGLSVEIIRKMLHLNIATNEPQIISVQHPYNQQHSAHLCTPVCLHIPHGEVSIFTLFLFIIAFVCKLCIL